MTTTILSIVLLVIATVSTLSAFDGKKDGRITRKGWIALCLVILTFGVGVSKEVYSFSDAVRKDAESALETKKDQDKASARQSELKAQLATTQGQLELANKELELANTKLQLAGTQLKDLKGDLKRTQDQITGGSGFPIAFITALNPDTDGSFPLWVRVHGEAPLLDVSYRIMEGEYKPPTPQEFQNMQSDAQAAFTGHSHDVVPAIGVLPPHKFFPLGASRIHPLRDRVNLYRILFDARNGSVMERLEVRFNTSEHIWQYRDEIRSQDPNSPEKLLLREDWLPKHFMPMIYGVGPPRNK